MGLTEAELQLTELLGQVLELLRWNQVLGYSNQYLLHEKLGLSPEERHRVMKAAAGAVEQDGRMQDWGKNLLEIQERLQAIHQNMTGEAADGAPLADPKQDSGDRSNGSAPGSAAAEAAGD